MPGRRSALSSLAAVVVVLLSVQASSPGIGAELPPATASANSIKASDEGAGNQGAGDLDTFLDRLMMAESGGSLTARNPRSTAVGPFQFIRSTFLHVVAKHFAHETQALAPAAIMALRTDLDFARRAAAAYTRDNAAWLASQGFEASYRNLRLAFLAGPGGAQRVLAAKPEARVAVLLGAAVIRANPFMARMTAADLLEKCERDIDRQKGGIIVAAQGRPAAAPRIPVKCNLARASCRRWLSLATARVGKRKGS